MTSRRMALLGLVSVGLILAGMAISAIPYRGYEGEAYSPFNHFISEASVRLPFHGWPGPSTWA